MSHFLFVTLYVQFSSVQSLSYVQLSVTLWTAALQASLSITNSIPGACSDSCPLSRWCHATISSSVVPLSSCLIFPSIRVFSNESVLCIKWPKYWSFSFSISPSNENSGLISFTIDCVVCIVLIVLHVQLSPSLLYKQSGNFSGVCFWIFVYSPYMHSYIIILSFVEMFLDPLWYGFHHLISYCVLSCIHLFLTPWL